MSPAIFSARLLALALLFTAWIAPAQTRHIGVHVKNSTPGVLPTDIVPYYWKNDADGNTFALGATLDPADHRDTIRNIRLAKIDPDGVPLWDAVYDAGASSQAGAMALDDEGNVYVTGNVFSAGQEEGVTLKYSPSGTALWTNRFQGSDAGTSGRLIVADTNGHAAVLFYDVGDMIVAKFDTDGSILWQKNLGEPATLMPAPFYGPEPGFALAFDGDGNLLFSSSVARTNAGPEPVVQIIKWNTDGLPLWTNRFESGLDKETGVIPQSIVTDKHGNIFLGTFSSRLLKTKPNPRLDRAAQRLGIVSYSSEGKLRWTRHRDNKNTLAYLITDHQLAVDHADAVYMTDAVPRVPPAKGSVLETDKYNNVGRPLWLKRTLLTTGTINSLRFQLVTSAHLAIYADEAFNDTSDGPVGWHATTVTYSISTIDE